ncbi:hypothetical protein ANN_06261 [Periplaneta americana]|uniref:Uncharacterized protein n=1 Tax=Periplaneta americana TaxID=6978 RepID=A0ABQ8TET6_PERAM|nr:hypothetical protein ANN_06261 [Periplaneta americana]
MIHGTRAPEWEDRYWFDEAWFHLTGTLIRKIRVYDRLTIRIDCMSCPFTPKARHIWCAMSRKRSFIRFCHTTINSERYLLLVRPFLDSLTYKDKERTWFQQGSVTVHTARVTSG